MASSWRGGALLKDFYKDAKYAPFWRNLLKEEKGKGKGKASGQDNWSADFHDWVPAEKQQPYGQSAGVRERPESCLLVVSPMILFSCGDGFVMAKFGRLMAISFCQRGLKLMGCHS